MLGSRTMPCTRSRAPFSRWVSLDTLHSTHAYQCSLGLGVFQEMESMVNQALYQLKMWFHVGKRPETLQGLEVAKRKKALRPPKQSPSAMPPRYSCPRNSSFIGRCLQLRWHPDKNPDKLEVGPELLLSALAAAFVLRGCQQHLPVYRRDQAMVSP